MKEFLIGVGVAALVAIGIVLYTNRTQPIVAPVPQDQQDQAGAVNQKDYNPQYFRNGSYANQLYTLSSVNSSSTPAALKSSSSGHFVVAAASTTGSASTTAITASTDRVFLQQESTTPIAGTTCNTTIATGTSISLVVVSATSTTNGFIATVPAAPATNPECFSYFIIK